MSHTGKKLSTFTIRKILICHFNLKFKKFRYKSNYITTSTFYNERFIFLKLLLRILKEQFTIIFIDESCFNFYYDKRKIWYNDKVPYNSNYIEYGNSFCNRQLILAATFDKIIYYETFEGINNSQTFNEFLNNLFIKIRNQNIDINLFKLYFYLDNSRIHDSEQTYNNFKNNKFKIIWGVNNYSNLDFCEYIFRAIKLKHYKQLYSKKYFKLT